MEARDVMTTHVVTVTPETDIRNIARIMIEHHISGVPVTDTLGHLVGIVTDGDLYRRGELGTDRQRSSWLELFGLDSKLAREYVGTHGHTAADVMTTRVFAVTPETPLRQIADLFERERIRRVPVVANGHLVGILSRANLVQALVSTPAEDARLTLSDQQIRDLVIAEYKRLPWGMPSEGNVIVTGAVVHLWGFVPSGVELDALRVAAEGIPGVKRFEDHTFRYFGDVGDRQRVPSELVVEEPTAATPEQPR
ncbi:MAG TPA: histidine kinase [Acetobacteraceae bacterium]|jgi:CBS domain-containing protein|nr:histidine kinase [Acetobacteraceae bacterium]